MMSFLETRFNGDGGIRTLVSVNTDKLISSQSRYGHFGTSPYSYHKPKYQI